mmetsp:Transcript_33356/g.70902  ORF Transcript_33356/g.70902 Transcript_33356/m.70902 type:complete len:389 (+) Transcript_33356:78-1244(+)
MRAILLPFLFTVADALVVKSTPDDPDLYATGASKGELNLDLPPEDRWTDYVKVHRASQLRWAENCAEVLESYGRDRVDRWLKAQWIPEDYQREMQGLVKAVDNANYTYECVFMQNLLYDARFDNGIRVPTVSKPAEHGEPHMMCSGVLAADPSGMVIHARNADWGHEHGTTAYGSVDMTATRGGKPVYRAIMNPPLIGMHSGMSLGPGAWSIEQNTRSEYGLDRDENVAWAEQGGHTSFFISRYIMEQGMNYSEALRMFAKMKWNSRQYLIMAGAGPWEGAVITIDPALSFQNVAVLNPDNHRFIYQLNSDSWLPPNDERDDVVLKWEARPHLINMNSIWNLITQGPDLYNDGNVFTYMAVPAKGYWRLLIHPEGSLAEAIQRKQEGA